MASIVKATVRIVIPLSAEDLTRFAGEAAEAAAHAAVAIIKRRTAQGIDADGKPFRPYTKRYRELRVDTGRNGTPDLTLTGQMLGNLKFKRRVKNVAWIGFSGSHRVTRFSPKRNVRRSGKPSRTLRRTKRSASGVVTAASVPMATVVLENNRLRPFFHLRSRKDQAEVARVVRELLDVLIRKANQDAGR